MDPSIRKRISTAVQSSHPDIYIYEHMIDGVSGIERNEPCYHVVCAHHDAALAETSITPYPNFLIERFLFNRGKRPRSGWLVHNDTITGGCQKGGKPVASSRYVCGGFCRRTRSPHFPIHECTRTLANGSHGDFMAIRYIKIYLQFSQSSKIAARRGLCLQQAVNST